MYTHYLWYLVCLTGLPLLKAQSDARFVGCYKDEESRVLPHEIPPSDEMTNEKCISTCFQKGFKYAGTQYSRHCFCGDSYWRLGQYNNCNMKCHGDSSQICGGAWASSVYKTVCDNDGFGFDCQRPCRCDNGAVCDSVYGRCKAKSDSRFVGCYKDAESRALPHRIPNSDEMTNEKCISTCFQKGYKYAGTEVGVECFCGNSYSRYGRADYECHYSCGGDSLQICGGYWAISVYKTECKNGGFGVNCLRSCFCGDGQVCDSGYGTCRAKSDSRLLGCYRDAESRALPYRIPNSNSMTNEKCISDCFQRGFRYAGTEVAVECFCGNHYSRYGQANNECHSSCGGDSSQICGGVWALSVYKTVCDNGGFGVNCWGSCQCGDLTVCDSAYGRCKAKF